MDENQQKYADKIRSQYTEKQTTKIDELRALDRKVKLPAVLFAYIFGIVGALVLGTGMCLAMKVIGDSASAGIAIGLIGIAMVAANYFIYNAILNSRKRKYSDRILALSNELLNK